MHCQKHYLDYAPFDAAGNGMDCPCCTLEARIAELEAVIDGMNKQADIVQIGSNRRWELLEESLTNFYRIELGTTGNETAAELAHRMAEKIHLELYEDLETNKD